MEVNLLDDGNTLEVLIDTCNADVDAKVAEFDDYVEVTPTRDDTPWFETGGDDCQDAVRVALSDPLGEREVRDESGNVLSVNNP